MHGGRGSSFNHCYGFFKRLVIDIAQPYRMLQHVGFWITHLLVQLLLVCQLTISIIFRITDAHLIDLKARA